MRVLAMLLLLLLSVSFVERMVFVPFFTTQAVASEHEEGTEPAPTPEPEEEPAN